jgi:ACT domain-containing protein
MEAIVNQASGVDSKLHRVVRRLPKWQMAVIAIILPIYAQAQEKVTVYVQQDAVVHGRVLIGAEDVASQLFAEAGVRIKWCYGHTTRDTISIEFSERTPRDFRPGSMAFALPYEGVHITVFFDRISKSTVAGLVPTVLGHVLAHEITHVIQRIDRHSETGVMKAHWTNSDLDKMVSRRLFFSAEDVELIQRGLSARVLPTPADKTAEESCH